jgi:hypothetical protein
MYPNRFDNRRLTETEIRNIYESPEPFVRIAKCYNTSVAQVVRVKLGLEFVEYTRGCIRRLEDRRTLDGRAVHNPHITTTRWDELRRAA